MYNCNSDNHNDKNSSSPNSATVLDQMSEIPARWCWLIGHVLGLVFFWVFIVFWSTCSKFSLHNIPTSLVRTHLCILF